MKWQCLNLQPLHAGGYGDLYVGLRSDTGERVVVKFLRDKHIAHAKKAFAREARILGRRLRGLVPLLSADTNGENPYYIMPFLEGGALSRYAGKLSGMQLQNVANELATTLANLHAAYIAHGDFKPDNVLVSKEGQLQVADPLGNGIGCTVLFSQNHGGTPGYWAPEVASGGSISMAGDAYSYGATLYELRTGQKPRDGQSFALNTRGCVHARKIGEIINACCQSEPAARPSMREVLRMLGGENWTDIEAERKQRQQLFAWELIKGTPNTTYYVSTKVPRNILKPGFLPDDWDTGYPNVMLVVSVTATNTLWRMDFLRDIPARMRVVSFEPLWGPIGKVNPTGFDWFIVGGHSGPGYNEYPMKLEWAKELWDVARDSKHVSYFFKQISAHSDEQGIDALDRLVFGKTFKTVRTRQWPKLRFPMIPKAEKGNRFTDAEWEAFRAGNSPKLKLVQINA